MKKNILIGILLICTRLLPAQTASIFDELSFKDVVKLEITTDIETLTTDKYQDKYQEASVQYKDINGEKKRMSLKVKPRGKYRRRVCGFPPLKLNFSKEELNNRGLSVKWDKLKLVTHCMDDKKEGQANLVKELTAYKLYEEISPLAFRTQLVEITYIDSANKHRKIKRLGFLIEDVDQVAARGKTKEYKDANNIDKALLSPFEHTKASVFQYMIGNLDWNPSIPRNVKLLEGENGYIPIPYDFDFSALVKPSYIRLNKNYGQTSIEQRIYLGDAATYPHLKEVIEWFKQKKSKLYQVINDSEELASKDQEKMLLYIDTFYSNLDELKQLSTTAMAKKESDFIPKGEG